MHGLPPHCPSITGRIFQGLARRVAAWSLFPSGDRYNVTVGSDPEFVWFRVAKCGTRSVFRALRESGAKLDVENGIFLHYRPNAMRTHLKFAFVRNPWDRFVSCFYDRVVDRNHFGFSAELLSEMQDLSRFIDYAEQLDLDRCDVHLRRQTRLIDFGQLDFLGRMENFQDDISTLFAKLELPKPALGRENVSSRPGKAGDSLSADQIGRIGKMYEKDARLFGYVAP